jgi:hypothetical protein
LNNLLFNLNNENQNKYGSLESDLYLENKQTNKDDYTNEDEEVEGIFNSYKIQDNCINNMSSYNLIDNISKKENKDNLSRNIITPSNQFFSLRQSKKSSEKNTSNNEKNFKNIPNTSEKGKSKSKKNNKKNDIRNILIQKNNNIKNNNNSKDHKQIFEIIKNIKDSNENNKKEILNYKNNIMKMFEIIIVNISKKENITNQQYQSQINQMINETNL